MVRGRTAYFVRMPKGLTPELRVVTASRTGFHSDVTNVAARHESIGAFSRHRRGSWVRHTGPSRVPCVRFTELSKNVGSSEKEDNERNEHRTNIVMVMIER